jgi:hypothetical protein
MMIYAKGANFGYVMVSSGFLNVLKPALSPETVEKPLIHNFAVYNYLKSL